MLNRNILEKGLGFGEENPNGSMYIILKKLDNMRKLILVGFGKDINQRMAMKFIKLIEDL